MKNYNKTPIRKAQLYALMAYSDKYTKEQAEEIAYTMEYDALNEKTKADDSIQTGIKEIKMMILKNRLTIPAQNTPEVWDTIIEILVEIHDKWVQNNAKKFNRGNDTISKKKLFQHLPTAFIGIDELSKDLMFLAPMLEELGLNAGEMQLVSYGQFKPCEDLVKAYYRYVDKYKAKYGIKTVESLSNHIENCIMGRYAPLEPVDQDSRQRISYMEANVGTLVMSVVDKNQDCLGMLAMTSEY